MNGIVLYDYWRSSASYRVRIALNRLGLEYETVPVNLLRDEHKGADNLSRNPQGLVPTLAMDGRMMTQSLAIIEYLDEIYVDAGFLPQEPAGRQRVRALSYAIAMEVHPVCNMGVMAHVLLFDRRWRQSPHRLDAQIHRRGPFRIRGHAEPSGYGEILPRRHARHG